MRKSAYLLLMVIGFSACQTNRSNEVFKDVFTELVIESNIYPLNNIQRPLFIKDTLREKLGEMSLKIKTLQKFISSPHKITILNKLLPASIKYFKYPDDGYASSLYDTTWIGNVDGQIKKQHESFNLRKDDFQVPNYEISFIETIPKTNPTFDYAAEHNDVMAIQLSNVVFNKEENRGLFYFSISEIDNSAGYMKFCYVEKTHNKWRIKKIE